MSEALLSDRYAEPELALPAELPPGITLQVYGRTRGFLARVYRGTTLRKLFSWRTYGGLDRALHAAVEWQREQREAWPPKERKRVPGYGYVQRGQRSYRDSAGVLQYYPAFIAWFWDGDGRPHQTSYSMLEHGEADAEARCYAWLERQRTALALELG